MIIEGWAILETAQGLKHLRDTVVYWDLVGSLFGLIGTFTCKHGDFVNVVEVSVTLAVEARPEVCDEYLGALVEAHGLAFEIELVLEARKVVN